ncbi:dihydroxyacetone kinase family protein [Phytomonospora endophytica]|uniref:Dihydroxyacetone kinase n=1 Tax=Phytomonospora endophytica TaxID=714109 RepID=A0A841G1W9_9ACTN|nr:dihydroxyacetone kinase family protein [Phytomonospora endophytica]MBB6038150.1 dihydroxyacetone kinase [Phytomonospora endophytica]GIG67387.1 erythrulose kinase [Phytomonospora endophytica]
MTRLFNDPAAFKDDMVEGFVAAYGRYVRRVPDCSGVMRASGPVPGKVGVIVGGGSGHYPAFCGLVGTGLADGAVIGDIFTSPSTEQAYRVGKAVDTGAGVLFSFGNYAGDVINFGLAESRLRDEGVDSRTVLVTDDIASAPPGAESKRRGIAGDFVVFKAAGAAAEQGLPIDEVERLARKANDRTRTLGAAFAGCTFPGAADPLFTVDPAEMELGLGIHGEPGVRTVERLSAAELAAALTDAVLAERPEGADGRAAVILNGLGATKYEELFVVWKDVLPRLSAAGIEVVTPEVGELVTSLDMAGCSLTLCWLDDELAALWNAPADTPAFRRGDLSGWVVTHGGETPAMEDTAVLDKEDVAFAAGVIAETAGPVNEEALRSAATVRACLAAMLAAVAGAERSLGELDAIAGDGDHGRGMVRGLRAACRSADDPALGPAGVLRAAGAAWADAGGGTSGALWGALLRAVGDAIGDEEPPDTATVAVGLVSGVAAIESLGGAERGDKTLLDALIPFQKALSGAGNAPIGPAWRAAADVAVAAAEATRDLVPKVGRARPLAERSVGTPDPGAVSLALCVRAVAGVLDPEGGAR